MIDDIVKMVTEEARARDKTDFLKGLYSAWDELRDKVHLIIVEEERSKWRKKHDRSNS